MDTPISQKTILNQIEEVLGEIRPMIALHRGTVELVNFDARTGVVSVRMDGTCKGCPLSELTLKAGIESILRERIKHVQSVERVD